MRSQNKWKKRKIICIKNVQYNHSSSCFKQKDTTLSEGRCSVDQKMIGTITWAPLYTYMFTPALCFSISSINRIHDAIARRWPVFRLIRCVNFSSSPELHTFSLLFICLFYVERSGRNAFCRWFNIRHESLQGAVYEKKPTCEEGKPSHGRKWMYSRGVEDIQLVDFVVYLIDFPMEVLNRRHVRLVEIIVEEAAYYGGFSHTTRSWGDKQNVSIVLIFLKIILCRYELYKFTASLP